MRLYFIRHGDKAEAGCAKPGLPHLDQPLSIRGRQQSSRLCKYFIHKPVRVIYVSEYTRTKQTIWPLSKRKNIAPITDARLNEIDLGRLVGLTDEQFQDQFPDVWKAYQERSADFRWPGGETGGEAQARIVDFLSEQSTIEGDKVIVTHDGMIRLLLCYLLKLPVHRRFEFRVSTAGILEIEKKEQETEWRIVRWNQELT